MPKPGTVNTLLTSPAQQALNQKINPLSAGTLNLSAPKQPSAPQTTFGNPSINAGGGALASTIGSALSSNTQAFNPASTVKNQGMFNVTPPPAPTSAPVMNLGSSLPGYATNINPSIGNTNVATVSPAAPQTNVSSTGTGLQTNQQQGAPTPPTPPAAPQTQFGGLVGGLSTFSPFANPQVSDAYQKAQDINTQLEQSKQNEAGALAQNNLQPIPIGDQQGRAQVLENQYLQQQSALSSQLQGQASLYQGGFAGTGQQEGALASAAGLAQPAPAGYGQTSFNPLTQSFAGSADGGLPSDTFNQYVQMALNGQYSAIPSSVTGNPQLNAQINAAAQKQNPSYSPITSEAQGSAAASNVQTAGTAQTSTAASGYQQAVQTYQNMNTIYNTANGQATNLVNDLASTGINASNSSDYNQAINSLSSLLGSTAITKIATDIAELQNTYSNLLSTGGGTPTGQEQQSLSILNPNSSASQINQAIQSLQAAAYPKLQSQYQQAQQYQSSLNSGSGQSSSGGGTISVGGYTFTKNAQGQYEAQ